MSAQDNNQLVIHDTPIALWVFGALFAGSGALFFVLSKMVPFLLIFVIAGLAILLLSSALTIIADRATGTLRLEYHSLLRHSAKEIALNDIASIDVERSLSRRKGRTRSTYRVVAALKDGTTIPFRSYYSSGIGDKEKQAEQLRAFLGVTGIDATPAGIFHAIPQIMQTASGIDANETHETNGVHWQAQTLGMGASPLTRWHSPDFKTPGSFLYLAQKVTGQASGGFIASLGAMLFKQSISLYGFGPEDTPGLDGAAPLTPLDPGLEPYFMALTGDPTSARQTLNPWAVMPLADWCKRHPLKQLQSGAGFGQLVILFGPNGVTLATLGLLQPAQLDELTSLGVELVKSQGSSSSTPQTGGASW